MYSLVGGEHFVLVRNAHAAAALKALHIKKKKKETKDPGKHANQLLAQIVHVVISQKARVRYAHRRQKAAQDT